MNISDYIPDYPELVNPDFNNIIFHKKEFYNLKTNADTEQFKGSLWNHQRLISRFLSPFTNYKKQLLYHTPGTGKTCAAAAIVEINKQDPLLRKPVLIIVPNETLENQWKQQIALTCTDNVYVPENYFSTDPKTKLTSGEKVSRLNKMLKPIYHITTIEKMRRLIDKVSSDKILANKFSNTIIIIDEAHNLRIETHTSKKNAIESKNRYNSFHRFLHLIESSKILLLTGTPMYDRITELPGLLNLLLPIDNQLPTGAQFSKLFLKKENGVRILKNTVELNNKLVGLVSFIREGGDFPQRVDIGKTKWTRFIKTECLDISSTQLSGYLQAFNKDKGSESSATAKRNTVGGLWKNSRQAANFVYKQNGKYYWGTEASHLILNESKKSIILDNKSLTFNKYTIKQQFAQDIKTNLAEYSSKYNYIVNFLKDNSKPTFIFNPLVSGAGGAIMLGTILELFGYTKAMSGVNTVGKRYALITGDDKSVFQRKRIIDTFNSPQNRNGELIQVLIATKTISEGTSLINVQHEIVVSPYWNNSGTEQAIGRGLRANSLSHLSERKVTIAQLAIDSMNLNVTDNIDAHLYIMSERKDFEIKAAERVLKKISWDCALNYDRNVRSKDVDFSRNCDYQKCNYVCYGVKPSNRKGLKWEYIIPTEELTEDTYLLYYSMDELIDLVEKIRALFQKFTFIDINSLDENISSRNLKILLLAIEYIIENNITINNKWGFSCFLRKEHNLLYLSNSNTNTNILETWYIKYPLINFQVPLKKSLEETIYKEDLQQLTCKNLNKLQLETRLFILEYFYNYESKYKLTEKKKAQLNKMLDEFKTNLFTFDNVMLKNDKITVHNIEKTQLQNYIDFEFGDSGRLRCFKNNNWENCGIKEEEELSKRIKTIEKNIVEEMVPDESIYGIVGTDKKFRIVDKTKEKPSANVDKRTIYRGKVCTAGWQKWQLVELYLAMNLRDIKPHVISKETDRNILMEHVTNSKLLEAVPQKPSLKTLQLIASLGKKDLKTLCKNIQEQFAEKGILVYQ